MGRNSDVDNFLVFEMLYSKQALKILIKIFNDSGATHNKRIKLR